MKYLSFENIKNDIITEIIKHYFNQFNMQLYYGSRKNLSCADGRSLYNSMIMYFINMLEYRLILAHSENSSLFYDNDSYICILAESAHFIRGSIKKYIRHRTANNQIGCSKESLEKRNSEKYSCPYPTPNDYICPTFDNLLKTKNCKEILKSSKTTSESYTVGSKLVGIINPNPRNNKSRKLSAVIPCNNKITLVAGNSNKTRKMSKRVNFRRKVTSN